MRSLCSRLCFVSKWHLCQLAFAGSFIGTFICYVHLMAVHKKSLLQQQTVSQAVHPFRAFARLRQYYKTERISEHKKHGSIAESSNNKQLLNARQRTRIRFSTDLHVTMDKQASYIYGHGGRKKLPGRSEARQLNNLNIEGHFENMHRVFTRTPITAHGLVYSRRHKQIETDKPKTAITFFLSMSTRNSQGTKPVEKVTSKVSNTVNQQDKTLMLSNSQSYQHKPEGNQKIITKTSSTMSPFYPPKSETINVAADNNRQVSNNGGATDCHAWCHRGRKMKPPYFLTAVLLVRIYVKDKAQLSSREMLQWLLYLRYAGVEHVYVYDAYVFANESQRDALGPLIDEEYVTYIDWHHRAYPYSIHWTQISAYQDCIDKWGRNSTWQTAIDIDEYPFSPNDTKPGFLQRFVSSFNLSKFVSQEISEICIQNFLFLGKPLDENLHPLLIDRILRRTPDVSNALVKPIYRPEKVWKARVHRNRLAYNEISVNADEKVLRLNHYWGARLQNWGEDTPWIIEITTRDESVKSVSRKLRQCGSCFGKDFIYRKKWN